MGYRLKLPPLPPVAPDASPAERLAALEAYRDELRALNPWGFDAHGQVKPWWKILADIFRGRPGR